MTDISRENPALTALENYQQADMDGIMALVSRQAIHEVLDSYRALRDEVDRLEQRTKCSLGMTDREICSAGTCYDCLADRVKWLQGEVDRLEATRGVKVKPLEWVNESTEEYGYFCAEALFGESYYVASYCDGAWGWFTSFKTEAGYSGNQGRGPTLEAAKAAAQADYERRIRSALEPDHSVWNAALEAAAILVENTAPISSEVIENSTALALINNIHDVLKSDDARENAAAIRALKRCTHPNLEASTCGFESCPDCGARLEED